MQSKEGGHDSAAPQKTRGAAEQVKKKHDVKSVKQEAGGMMPGCVETEELDVHHVGNPCQGMPIGHDGRAKGPGNIVKRQARLQKAILRDVAGIVVIDKTVRESRPVGKQSNRNQEQRDQPWGSRVIKKRRSLVLSRFD